MCGAEQNLRSRGMQTQCGAVWCGAMVLNLVSRPTHLASSSGGQHHFSSCSRMQKSGRRRRRRCRRQGKSVDLDSPACKKKRDWAERWAGLCSSPLHHGHAHRPALAGDVQEVALPAHQPPFTL